ncbi:hypothetical protein N665_0424s0018 [Sinapis alba]|nr:hypothetical protein N665_0424s0018 [Sinapis alba]
MGLREGHIFSGCALVAFGLWHLFNNIKLFCLRPNTFSSSPWFPTSKTRYLELYLIMSYSSVFMSLELFFGLTKHQPRNFEHSSIAMSLLAYAVVALVLDRARPRAVASEGLTLLALAAAFTQELFLFHFHSADHMGLEGQYHLIFQLIIFISILTTLMGFMLYTPSLIPKGCSFQDREIRRTMVKCSTEEALHRAKSLGGNVEYCSPTTDDLREQHDEEQQEFESQLTQKMSFVQMGKLVNHGDKM